MLDNSLVYGMTDTRRYNIEELGTNGWHVLDEQNVTNLDKEDAKRRLDALLQQGLNPNSLRATLVQ